MKRVMATLMVLGLCAGSVYAQQGYGVAVLGSAQVSNTSTAVVDQAKMAGELLEIVVRTDTNMQVVVKNDLNQTLFTHTTNAAPGVAVYRPQYPVQGAVAGDLTFLAGTAHTNKVYARAFVIGTVSAEFSHAATTNKAASVEIRYRK